MHFFLQIPETFLIKIQVISKVAKYNVYRRYSYSNTLHVSKCIFKHERLIYILKYFNLHMKGPTLNYFQV